MKFWFIFLISLIIGYTQGQDPRNFEGAVRVTIGSQGEICTKALDASTTKTCSVKNGIFAPTEIIQEGGSCKTPPGLNIIRLCSVNNFCNSEGFCRPVREVENGDDCSNDDSFLYCKKGKVCVDRECRDPVPKSFQVLLPLLATINALALIYISREFYKNY